jgi:hypothetical protein
MQGTAEFHNQIADARLPQAEPIFDDATALDATVDVLDPQPAVMEPLIRPLLLHRQLLATWGLCWHEDLHVGKREGQKAEIL